MPKHDPEPASTQPVLDIIIPHYNDVARLCRCLDALVPQLIDVPIKVTVVDNGSTDDMSPLDVFLPTIRLVTAPEKGAANARNAGVAATGAPTIVFLDADCVPAPNWVQTALRYAGADRVIGGRIDVFDETPVPRTGSEAFETVFAFHQEKYVRTERFCASANLLTSRRVFNDVGPFVDGVSEDRDWGNRAVDRGWPLEYRDDLAVSHPTRSHWIDLRKKWRRLTIETYALHQGRKLARPKWALRAVAVLGSAFIHTGVIAMHSRLAPREKIAASLTLFRIRSLRALWMLSQAFRGQSEVA